MLLRPSAILEKNSPTTGRLMRKLPPRITIKIIRITNTNDVTPMCYSLKNILALIIKNCDYFSELEVGM